MLFLIGLLLLIIEESFLPIISRITKTNREC